MAWKFACESVEGVQHRERWVHVRSKQVRDVPVEIVAIGVRRLHFCAMFLLYGARSHDDPIQVVSVFTDCSFSLD